MQETGKVPSPIPPRDRKVFFFGAGLSSAFRLSNTPSLLTDTLSYSKSPTGNWLSSHDFSSRLEEAFRFFYPDALHIGFQPDVVDFFSTLRTYIEVGAGLVGTGFRDAPDLYRLLRRGIGSMLLDQMRNISSTKFARHGYLTDVLRPGNIVITSNWDLLVEMFGDKPAFECNHPNCACLRSSSVLNLLRSRREE